METGATLAEWTYLDGVCFPLEYFSISEYSQEADRLLRCAVDIGGDGLEDGERFQG